MDKIFQPELLTDKSRLQEIYNLRVKAYENSPHSIHINKNIFPNGWSDHLDDRERTFHFIIQDNNKIVASSRLAIIDNLQEITDLDESLEKFEIPQVRPFAYYSRLVVHKDYRKLGFVESLDKVRIDFLNQHAEIHFAIAWASPNRHKALLNSGFIHFGDFNYTFGLGIKKQQARGYLFLQLLKKEIE